MAHFHHFSICNQNQSISILVIFRWPKYQGYSLTFWPKMAHFHHFSICNQNQSISILVIFRLWPKYQGYSLTFWPQMAHFHHFSICNQNQSISILVIFRVSLCQNTKAIALLLGQTWLIFITFQSAIKINQFQFWSVLGQFVAKIPRLQPYFLAKNGSFSSLFNLQSKSINFNFGHFWPKYQGYSLTFWPKMAHFHHFSICNQNQSISILVICGQTQGYLPFGHKWLIFGQFWPYQGYSLTFWPQMAHFHHFQSAIKINQFQFWSFFANFGQNTKAIALLFGQKWLIFITFQSAIKINQFQFWSFFAGQNTKAIALLFGQTLAHFHHFSICNQNQSISILVIFGQNTKAIALLFGQKWLIFITFQSAIKINQFQFRSFFAHLWPNYQGYSLTFWPKMAHFHHLSICNQNQSISILVIFGQNTKAIALLFGQKWLIFITFQSAIKINQFQFWSFVAKIPRLQPYFLAKNGSFSSLFNLQSKSINFNFGHFWPKYQGYSLTFWPKMAHFHHFSICNQNQSISISVWSVLAKIPRLQPYFLAKNGSFSSLFNLQSKSINFNFGHFWPKYQGYSLTFWPKIGSFSSLFNLQSKSINFNSVIWSFLAKIPRLQPYFLPKMAHFHHFSICNQNQSISILVIFGQNTKAIALLFGQKWLIFITFQSAIKINQFQFRWSFLAKIPRLQPYCLATNGSFSSLFNLQSKSINFNFGHFWPKYQGYSLTFWPKMAHFHHFSICNQNQSISILVIFTNAIVIRFGQNTKAIALLFGQNTNGSFSSLFNLQSKSINFNFGHFWPKYQGYSLTFWPKMAHFHRFSICNQNQSISILVIFGQNTKAIALLFGQKWLIFITFQSAIKINQFQFWSFLAKIPRLQPYCLAKNGSFSSLFNLQSKSINFNFGHFSLWPKYQGYSLTFWPKMAHFHHFSICNQNQSISIWSFFAGQNTKAIALLFGQKWLIFITFQSAIKINQFQFWSFLAKIPRLQPYFLAKNGSFSSLFNLQSKSINFNFGQFSLTFWSVSSLLNLQSKSMNFKFGHFWPKIPRLQPYFLAKIGSFSSLFNLQSKSINFNFGHFWPKYQGYSLTFWPKMAHFHHFSICNQNQSISISVGHLWPNYQGYSLSFWPKLAHFHHFSICNQNQSMSISVMSRSFLAKIPRLQPYFLAKIGSFSSLFNLQSKSINFNFGHFSLIFGQNTTAIALLFGQNWLIFITFQSAIKINQFQFRSFLAHFWPKYQGYSLTFWPKLAHFHHFSICNQSQSISISVISRSFLANIPRLQPYFLAKIGSFSSLFNLQSKSINFNFGHFSLIFGQNTKAIALLFGQNWLIFITFQSAIKINQFQFRSFFADFWPKHQGYSHTVWPQLAHFHHFSICNQNQSISISVIFRSVFAKTPRLQPYFLAKIGSFSSLFNLQSKSINFNFGHFSLMFGQNTKAIALLFGQNWLIFITFQSAIKINQFQFRSFFAQFLPKYQDYSHTFWPNLAHFHHFSICNQNQSISISVISRSFLAKIPRLQPYFQGHNWLIFITFQSAIKINQFQFRSFFAHLWPNTKAIALLFGQNWLFFITFQSAIKISQFQFRSFLAHFWPKYHGYSLTFRAILGSFSSLFNLQSKSINFNFGHFSLIFGQNTKAIALLSGQNWLIFITFQSPIKINQFQFRSFFAQFLPKYQGYSHTFWPNLAHFHHFSICNQNQSISISVIFRSVFAKIPRLQPQFLAKIGSFSSLFNLQSKSINFNFGHFSLSFCQNTKAIALLFGQNWLFFITFQSAIKINQFQFRSFLAHFWPKYHGYSLTFRAIIGSFSSLFNLQSKSINFNFGHFSLIFGQNTTAIALLFGHNWLIFITFQSAIKINQFQFRSFVAQFLPKYQGYSHTFWPNLAHFHHFSICNQNQSISISVIFR